MAEDELKLRLGLENLQYKKAWADVRVQTAKDLAQIKSTVTTSLNQTRVSAANSLAGIRQAAAASLGQARVNTAQQLAQIRVNTAAQLNQIRQNAQRTLGNLGSQFESAGRRMSVGLTLPLAALAVAAVRSARDIDAQVNTLRAFTGSAEAAEKRLAQLIATSQKTPGLTTALALQLDAQLRVAQATEQTIDRILPAVGRLNAVQRLEDPGRFTQNLVQLVTQNFERRDLKELIGQSPLAGQVIRELFNVDSPINGEAIRASAKKMGIRTVDEFFAAFADAAARNKGLQNVTESIGTAFDKMADRVAVSLRPLGLAIIDAFKPILDFALPILESLGKAFNDLPGPVKTGIVVIGGFAASMGPAVFIAGSLINTIASLQKAYIALNALALIPTRANLQLLSQVMSGTASLTAGAGATAAVSAGGWVALAAAVSAVVGALGFAIGRFTEAGTAAETSGATWARVLLPILSPMGALGFQTAVVTAKTKDLGGAQAAAVPPVKNLTAAVEEESKTLRELKRALEEAEIATRSRVAAVQRAYNEERITVQQATAAQVDALLEGQKTQLAVIDQGIRESQERLKALEQAAPQGLGSHGADDKDARAERDKLERLLLDRLKLTSDTATQIEDLRSQQRIKERQLEKEHTEEVFAALQQKHARQLELFDLQARQYVERQKALAQAEIITYAEAQRRITAEQALGFEKRRLLLEAELRAAKGNAEKEAELLHQLAVLKEQAALFAQEVSGAASAAVSDDLDRMIEKVDALLERIDRLRAFNLQPPFDTPGVDLSPTPLGEGPTVDPGQFQAEFGAPPDMAPHIDAIQIYKNSALEAFGAIQQGFGSMIQAFLLGEKFSGKAFAAMAKQAIAAVAAEAAVRALFEVAMGLAKLWLNPAEAGTHFAAAKVFGVVAAFGAAAALAIPGGSTGAAGSLADGSAGSSFGSGGRTSERDRTIRESRTGGAPDPNQPQLMGYLAVDVKHDDGHVERQLVKVWNSMGKFRDTVSSEMQGTAPSY